MSKPNFPKKTDAFLESKERDLAFVLQKIKHIAAMDTLVKTLLAPAIAARCQVANIDGDKLVILCTNSAINTQVHFQIPDLLTAFKKYPILTGIKQIHVKVNKLIKTHLDDTTTRKVKPLTPETAAIIAQLAEGIDDKDLKAAMQKIALQCEEK